MKSANAWEAYCDAVRTERTNRTNRRIVIYRFGWAAFFLLGNYLYFTSDARNGAAALFLSDPMSALNKYYIGNPLESLGACLMWAAAYQAGMLFVEPDHRARHTISSFLLIVVSFGLYSQVK